jgi:hypothetical protein
LLENHVTGSGLPVEQVGATCLERGGRDEKQIGKIIPLREMINWCLRNPLEGKPIPADDARMIAIEAYLAYERRGVALAPGKH